MEDAIFGAQFTDPATGYAAYLDVDSAINYYLINEVFKNVDGNLRLSTFLFKKRDGKLTFGPVWDFDLAIGNVNYDGADQTAGWHIRPTPWFTRLFQDPAFAQKVRTRWAQLKSEGKLDAVFSHIDMQAQYLQGAQARNFSRWNILNIYVWPNRVVTGSYAGEVNAMKDWLRARIAWMDTQLAL
jgi:CotH kinase protein